jgi:hypothetical protein
MYITQNINSHGGGRIVAEALLLVAEPYVFDLVRKYEFRKAL